MDTSILLVWKSLKDLKLNNNLILQKHCNVQACICIIIIACSFPYLKLEKIYRRTNNSNQKHSAFFRVVMVVKVLMMLAFCWILDVELILIIFEFLTVEGLFCAWYFNNADCLLVILFFYRIDKLMFLTRKKLHKN
jgi:hypothetical protein